MSDPAQSIPLTFDASPEASNSFLLTAFIGLSLLGHAVMFYLFQVSYPSAVAMTPPPVQVTLFNAGTARDTALFPWLEAEDPAIATATSEVSPPGLMDLAYKPFFEESHSLPEAIEQKAAPVGFPPARSAFEMVGNTGSFAGNPFPQIKGNNTLVTYSGRLGDRKAKPSELKFPGKARVELQPSRYLVAVDAQGQVRYMFLGSNSGDDVMDRRAERHLMETEFEAIDGASLTWGYATYSWGVEAYAP